MARAPAHPSNAPGDWSVDTRCIDCDACRQLAPEVFASAGDQSVVERQPRTPAARLAAWRALVACPTRSIHYAGTDVRPKHLFPLQIADGLYLCGYNSVDSFGANAYFVRRPEGNLLVDSPRYVRALAGALEEMGGVSDVLLTHRDDVADADRYAERFGARVWIHRADRSAAPYATDVIEGADPIDIRPGLVAIPVPGHTRGSVCYLLEGRYLFTGDSLAWDREDRDLVAFEDATWYSWGALTDSLDRLIRRYSFEWVLPGHGDRAQATAAEMRRRGLALVERMRAA